VHKDIVYTTHAKARMEALKITKAQVEETVLDPRLFAEQNGDRTRHDNHPVAVVFAEKEDILLVVTAFRILPQERAK